MKELYPLVHGKGGSGRTACHRRKKKYMEHVQWHREHILLNSEDMTMEKVYEEDNDVITNESDYDAFTISDVMIDR